MGKAYDMGRFQRVVQYEGERITGKFCTSSSKSQKNKDSTWVHAVDVTVWDETRRSGRVLNGGDLYAEVSEGVADLEEHMVASNKLAEVQDVWQEMKDALVAVAAAAVYDEEDDK